MLCHPSFFPFFLSQRLHKHCTMYKNRGFQPDKALNISLFSSFFPHSCVSDERCCWAKTLTSRFKKNQPLINQKWLLHIVMWCTTTRWNHSTASEMCGKGVHHLIDLVCLCLSRNGTKWQELELGLVFYHHSSHLKVADNESVCGNTEKIALPDHVIRLYPAPTSASRK